MGRGRDPAALPDEDAENGVVVLGGDEPDTGPATGSGAPAKSARTLELALGVQIRLFRRQHDLSVSDLAGAAGISTGMLSKIENGQISPSLSTLQAIASALGTPISTLFSTFEDRQDCSYVRANQGVVIERRGTKSGHVYELLGHALGGAVAVVSSTGSAAGPRPMIRFPRRRWFVHLLAYRKPPRLQGYAVG